MMSKPNLFIIITDSARAFSGSGDDRKKPDFYDSLTGEGLKISPRFLLLLLVQ